MFIPAHLPNVESGDFMKRLLVLLGLPLIAYAGIRGVGLGGGHGEMQAFLADQKLPQILAGISGCEGLLTSDSRPLRPDTTCHSKAEPGTVYISSCDLYEFGADGEISGTKNFAEIAALVLAARTNRGIAEARALLAGLEVKELSFAVLPGDAELKIRLLEVKHARGTFASFMIESPSQTLDMNSQLEAALGCASEPSWRLEDLRVYASASPDHAVSGNISWRCGDETNRASLRIFIRYEGHEMNPADIRFLLLR
jgi:hypothetical protein